MARMPSKKRRKARRQRKGLRVRANKTSKGRPKNAPA